MAKGGKRPNSGPSPPLGKMDRRWANLPQFVWQYIDREYQGDLRALILDKMYQEQPAELQAAWLKYSSLTGQIEDLEIDIEQLHRSEDRRKLAQLRKYHEELFQLLNRGSQK